MKEKPVIDRFEGDMAVFLVGDKERRLFVPRKSLPAGLKEGQWLKVELDSKKLASATIDNDEIEKVKARVAEKLARLGGQL